MIPKDVLLPEKMEKLMLDMMRTDEYLSQNPGTDSLNLKRTDFYQKVLKVNNTSKEAFKKSFNFYQGRPDLLKVILDSMHSQATILPPSKQNNSLRKKVK